MTEHKIVAQEERKILTGRHTMPAGQFLSTFPSESVSLIITDPPWDITQGAGTGEREDSENCLFHRVARYPRLDVRTIARMFGTEGKRILTPGCHLYTFAPSSLMLEEVISRMESFGWTFLRQICWDKGDSAGLGSWFGGFEPILIYSNGDTRGYEKRMCAMLRARDNLGRTAKPWPVIKSIIEMSSREGELVIDPFCGTNPLRQAVAHCVPPRRWAAADVFTEAEVLAQVREGFGSDIIKSGSESGGPLIKTAKGERQRQAGLFDKGV